MSEYKLCPYRAGSSLKERPNLGANGGLSLTSRRPNRGVKDGLGDFSETINWKKI